MCVYICMNFCTQYSRYSLKIVPATFIVVSSLEVGMMISTLEGFYED